MKLAAADTMPFDSAPYQELLHQVWLAVLVSTLSKLAKTQLDIGLTKIEIELTTNIRAACKFEHLVAKYRGARTN